MINFNRIPEREKDEVRYKMYPKICCKVSNYINNRYKTIEIRNENIMYIDILFLTTHYIIIYVLN